MNNAKRGPGAPKKAKSLVASERLHLRFTKDQRKRWTAKAKKAGVSLSAWVKSVCDQESRD